MIKHLKITCLGFLGMGFASMAQLTGIKAGLGRDSTLAIFIIGFLLWGIAIFYCMPKVCKFIEDHEKPKQQ